MDPMGIGQKRRCKGLPPRKATRFLVVNLIFLTAMNENLGPTKMGLKGRMAYIYKLYLYIKMCESRTKKPWVCFQ